LAAGDLLVQADYAATLRQIAEHGPGIVYGGALGRRIAEHLETVGSFLRLEDLAGYRTIEREPVRGLYRGVEVVGPPPPCSGGVHT
ncbi:gamma-glutamyltransferase, partial [Stenotrophomonas maltophilia]|uniref:gamma-glutamyltransferase n=1 Tax=Stenotrophomonas maltophilia TaxID=40324 RepID=UPI001954B218